MNNEIKWNYPWCPNHKRTKLRVMDILWHEGHIEFCEKGCLWGYDLHNKKWYQLKVEVA